MTSELARRIAFTLGALLLYRIGTYIPVPGINPAAWAQIMHAQDGSILGVFNAGSGGAIERLSILSLGIIPYLSAAFIVQLMRTVSSRLEALNKEGEAGRKTINAYARHLTVLLAAFQAYGISMGLEGVGNVVSDPGPFFRISTTITLTGGTMFLVWLCNQITLRGIDNGFALILSAAIVLQLAGEIIGALAASHQGLVSNNVITGFAVLSIVLVAVATLMEKARRREPVAFSLRTDGGAPRAGTAYLAL